MNRKKNGKDKLNFAERRKKREKKIERLSGKIMKKRN